jgi:hypothetical protein
MYISQLLGGIPSTKSSSQGSEAVFGGKYLEKSPQVLNFRQENQDKC